MQRAGAVSMSFVHSVAAMPPHHPWLAVHDTESLPPSVSGWCRLLPTEQTGATGLDIDGYTQIPDGVSLPVKGTGIGTVSVRTDGRPRFVIQINVPSQHSIRKPRLSLRLAVCSH